MNWKRLTALTRINTSRAPLGELNTSAPIGCRYGELVLEVGPALERVDVQVGGLVRVAFEGHGPHHGAGGVAVDVVNVHLGVAVAVDLVACREVRPKRTGSGGISGEVPCYDLAGAGLAGGFIDRHCGHVGGPVLGATLLGGREG